MDDYEETKLHEAEPPEQRRWLKSRRLLMWALYIVAVLAVLAALASGAFSMAPRG